MRTIFLALLLTACGQDHGGGSGQSNLVDTPEQQPEQPAAEKQYAEFVADTASLPACDATIEGRIAYVKADASLVACAAGAWSPIDLKGAAGVAGVKGEKGAPGDKGDDGVAAAPNTWLDSVSGKTWLLGGGGTFNDADATCVGDWRLPTGAEITAASNHGMYSGFSGMTVAGVHDCALWNDGGMTALGVVKPGATCGGTPNGIYCVEDVP